MSEYGIKIKNIKASTLYEYNLGVRNRYEYKEAILSNSLFSDYMKKLKMHIHTNKIRNTESTLDIVCLEFDFKSRSFEEEMIHINNQISNCLDEELKKKFEDIKAYIELNEEKYVGLTAEEIRDEFYENGVSINYEFLNRVNKDKDESQDETLEGTQGIVAVRVNPNQESTQDTIQEPTKESKTTKDKVYKTIKYKMLFRTPSKAKVGEAMFINEKYYNKAYDWLTMGLGKKMDKDNAKIVEMSAYAPLTTSTIVGKIHIPVEDVLILKDQESVFKTLANIVKAEDYDIEKRVLDEEKTDSNIRLAIKNNKYDSSGNLVYRKSYKTVKEPKKKCIVVREETEVKNVLWDGMAIIDSDYIDSCHLPVEINGMVLLRQHFFKSCGVRGYIQIFLQDYCKENGIDYDTYEIEDMFGVMHKAKDIKAITTHNSIKWIKFAELMGKDLKEAYQYWINRVNADDSLFGIVKTDHKSKLGDVQQMSYQMINTLPCVKEDIEDIAAQTVDYISTLKTDNDEFERFLRSNANIINHYEMLADLYKHNKEFANSKWFRAEKKDIIAAYTKKIRKGKVVVNGDNLTIFGNPYALLMYTVGQDFTKDPTLNFEAGTIQCYTKRFADGEFISAMRNPHNSPNNICYMHNHYSELMEKYFNLSENILAVNCINTDIQDRTNSCDFDSDFLMCTNQKTMVKCAKTAYEEFPTIVNALKESGIVYPNTKKAYSDMDNKFAKSASAIGESSNLAQLAMTYYWTDRSGVDLYDNFVILSVIAQVAIDSCKREYEVDPSVEIARIKKMECMKMTKVSVVDGKNKTVSCDLPEFMRYTKVVSSTKNGKMIPFEQVKETKNKLFARINDELECPMNWLQDEIDKVPIGSCSVTTPTKDFFIKMSGNGNDRQMTKIRTIVDEYDSFMKIKVLSKNSKRDKEDNYANEVEEKLETILESLQKIKIGNIVTINRLVETSLDLHRKSESYTFNDTKYTRRMLNLLYKMNKEKFLINFVSQE